MLNIKKYIAYTFTCWRHRQTSFAGMLMALLAAMVCACSSGADDGPLQPPTNPEVTDPTQYLPLTFSATTADKESYSTRAQQTGSDAATTLDNSFSVLGVKLMSHSSDYAPQTVFNQTPVTYAPNTAGTTASNTTDWEYVKDDEYIRYWDQMARGYIFYGYAPSTLKDATGNNVSAKAVLGVGDDNTKGTVTVSHLKGGAKAPTTDAYISLPTVISEKAGQTRFQGSANLTFLQPLARIRIGFLSGSDDYSTLSPTELQIKGVFFAPVEATKVPASGNVTATYAWKNEENSGDVTADFACVVTYNSEATSDEAKLDRLEFNNYGAYHPINTYYTLTANQFVEDALYVYGTDTGDDGDGKVTPTTPESTRLEKQWYYVFPQEAAEWRLSIKTTSNGVDFDKTAVVPAKYMGWLPNHQYTYIFKVSPTSLSIVGVDVKVMDWAEGGDINSEQHHW